MACKDGYSLEYLSGVYTLAEDLKKLLDKLDHATFLKLFDIVTVPRL
jgi:hypothetical protein